MNLARMNKKCQSKKKKKKEEKEAEVVEDEEEKRKESSDFLCPQTSPSPWLLAATTLPTGLPFPEQHRHGVVEFRAFESLSFT